MLVESLKDGTTVIVRELTLDDLDRSHRFFSHLRPVDRRYLRFNVANKQVVERLIRDAELGKAYRVVALVDDDVIAHGVLEISSEGWQSHVGEIRVLVAKAYRRQRLGAKMIGYLFREAERRGVEKVVVKFAEPQRGVREACERLGFHVDAVLKDYIKDSDGALHAQVIMSCPLDEVSRSLREMYREENWPDG